MQTEIIQTNIPQIKAAAPVKEKTVQQIKKDIPIDMHKPKLDSNIQPVGNHSIVIVTTLQNGEQQTYPNPKGLQLAEAMAHQLPSQIAMTA